MKRAGKLFDKKNLGFTEAGAVKTINIHRLIPTRPLTDLSSVFE